jgi:hypothetical protein
MRRGGRILALDPGIAVALILAIVPRIADAQALAGRVVDSSSGQPLPGVVVTLGGRSVTGDESGRFIMANLLPGRWRLELRHLGYTPLDTMVSLETSDTVRVAFAMKRLPPQLDTVSVKAAAPGEMPGEIREFEVRRARATGHFITREELRKNDERRLQDVLRGRLPGLGLQVGDRGTFMYSRSQQPPGALLKGAGGKPCYIQVVQDGVVIYRHGGMSAEGPPDISQLLTQNYDAIEFYAGPSRTPPEFRTEGAMCGTLVLWTRRK